MFLSIILLLLSTYLTPFQILPDSQYSANLNVLQKIQMKCNYKKQQIWQIIYCSSKEPSYTGEISRFDVIHCGSLDHQSPPECFHCQEQQFSKNMSKYKLACTFPAAQKLLVLQPHFLGSRWPHFITLDPLPFQKVRTSCYITFLSHLQAHTALQVFQRYFFLSKVFKDTIKKVQFSLTCSWASAFIILEWCSCIFFILCLKGRFVFYACVDSSTQILSSNGHKFRTSA